MKPTPQTDVPSKARFLSVGNRVPKLWVLLKLAARDWWKDNTSRFAAALAFYTLFSFAPVVLIAVGVAGFFYVPAQAMHNVVARVRDLAGGEVALAVEQVLRTSNGVGKSIPAVVIGVVTFIFGATVVFGELQAALNKIWDVRPAQGKGLFLKVAINRVRSFGIALAAGFLLVFSLIASSVIHNLRIHSGEVLGRTAWVWYCAHAVVSFAVVVMLFAMIYKYLSDVRLNWRDVWMGSVLTAVLFTIGKSGIAIYLGYAAVTNTFGAAGSLAALLVWVYYSALISFFGAEFMQVYARQQGRYVQPGSYAVAAGRKAAHEPPGS